MASTQLSKKHFVFVRLMPPVLVWGGLEKLMMEWFERIDYNQCQVTLIVSSGSGDLYRKHIESKKISINVIEYPFRKDFRYVEGFFQRLVRAFWLFNQLRPASIIFFQGSFMDFDLSHVLAANWAARGEVFMHENLGAPEPSTKSSKKYFGFIPGIALWWYVEKYFTPLRARYCKKVYVVSAEIKQRMIELWGYPTDKLEVMYHGVDTKRFSPSANTRETMRQSAGISSTDIVIIVAARLSQEKCIDRAINAFDQLSNQFPNMHLLIAGTGPYEDRLKKLAGEKSSNHQIKFLGHITNVHEYYQMSDIYILSSDNEGLSLAFLEALASGLVCVVTRCTGTTEVIRHLDNGLLVDKNFDGVLNGLKTALELPVSERQTISAHARAFVTDKFEINRNVTQALNKLGLPTTSIKMVL